MSHFVAEFNTNTNIAPFRILAEPNESAVLSEVSNTSYQFHLYGYLLNEEVLSSCLEGMSKESSNFESLLKLFCSTAKGSYWGYLVDHTDNRAYLFVDNASAKKLFFKHAGDNYFISTRLKEINKYSNSELDEFSIYAMLTYGGMIGERTLLKGVQKLLPGECWSFSSQGANLLFNAGYNEVNYRNKSKSQILSDIENVWQENVKLEYDYDVSRGKKHLSTLSGGLDSRLLVMTADDLGFSENDNLCFSQKGYLDEVIAEKVANHLNQKFLFIDLSGGSYLSDIEENTYFNEGLVFYSGSGHLNSALKTIKSYEYSLLHTGLIGDGLLGGFVSDKKVIKASSLSNRLSTRFYDKISTDLDLYVQKFSNEETYKLQNRGLNVAICAAWVSEAHGVPLSAPFLHKDFIDLCLSIPPELKWNQNIYIDWVNKYHKNTTQFRWERTKLKPNAKWKTEAGRYIEHALKYGGKLLPKLKSYNMNPYDVWLKDKSLSDSLKCYFEKALSTQHMSTEIKRDLHSMFYTGTSIEKILSLTVAAAIIMLYDE